MSYKFILAIDPSGSYNEGKGTTGWCVMNTMDNVIAIADAIDATKCACAESYWHQHLILLDKYYKRYGVELIIVIEDYFLYAHKLAMQINSRMETSKLLGIIQHHCWKHSIPYVMQPAALVMNRWTDEILNYKGYIQKKGKRYCLTHTKQLLNRHCKDAIRHAVHYAMFKNEKEA